MHDYGQQLTLESSNAKEPVATLPAKVDQEGHLLGIPVVTFFQTGGSGCLPATTDGYFHLQQSTGKLLRGGAMGIVVGYFAPQDALRLILSAIQRYPLHTRWPSRPLILIEGGSLS